MASDTSEDGSSRQKDIVGDKSTEHTLTSFIKENYPLLAVLGILAALILYNENMNISTICKLINTNCYIYIIHFSYVRNNGQSYAKKGISSMVRPSKF